MKHYFLFSLVFLFTACQLELEPSFEEEATQEEVEVIDGEPLEASNDIYESSNLKDLCLTSACEPDYDKVPSTWLDDDDFQNCRFYENPLSSSQFLVGKPETINGFELLLSKEDLFFLAWASMRYQINPHFLLGTMIQESNANCRLVSPSSGEGCFQITNTFGQAQLEESYFDRVKDWVWSDRSGDHYDSDLFIDDLSYFGEESLKEQTRMRLDPYEDVINETLISNVVDFHFGVIASALYHHWQQYLIYYRYASVREDFKKDIQNIDSFKASWQAAAYNGGAYGASVAYRNAGDDFLDEMYPETQNYAPGVLDYCLSFKEALNFYHVTYTFSDIEWMIDLLSLTYPDDNTIDWPGLKQQVQDIFFSEENAQLSLIDDIKALIYVISTYDPSLSPEWPEL